MKGVDKGFWDDNQDVFTNTVRGENTFQFVVEALKKAFEGWEFGGFTEKDLPGRQADRWMPMKPEHFGDVEEFNRYIPMRYGVRERNGVVWHKNLIICFMPEEYREKMLGRMHDVSENYFKRAVAHEAVTPDGARVGTDHHEEKRVMATENKPKRGRPKKSTGG